MAINQLQRIFKYKDQTFKDPNPAYNEKEVRDLLSNQIPELVNASISGPTYEGDKAVYKFEANVGRKG